MTTAVLTAAMAWKPLSHPWIVLVALSTSVTSAVAKVNHRPHCGGLVPAGVSTPIQGSGEATATTGDGRVGVREERGGRGGVSWAVARRFATLHPLLHTCVTRQLSACQGPWLGAACLLPCWDGCVRCVHRIKEHACTVTLLIQAGDR